ncbi:MAG: nuclear transport factor 2 family protein [Gemmatimonadales bacterium]|jgi:ketosteroid isomerase-like protein
MKTRFTAPFAIIAGLMLAACQPRDTETATESEYGMPDFAAMNEAYDAATNAGDAEAMGMLYAVDAVSMPPNAASLVGRAAIVADAAADFEIMTANLSSNTEGHYLMGDMAVDWGTYLFTGTFEDSDVTVTEEGKYVAIWKAQPDGSWQIVRDIWNSNTPAAMEDEAPMEGESE